MHIGIPKERKADEYRVALTPFDVKKLIESGHTVVVETGAGEGANLFDSIYEEVGALIADQKTVWQQDMIIKVKEPQLEEYKFFRDGQIVFSYLHLAANQPLTTALMKEGVTGIAFETFTEGSDPYDRATPLLDPMSEIAGRMAAQVGAHYLLRTNGGKGILMSDARVVVIGCGTAGRAAGIVADGMGATVGFIDLEGLPLERARTFIHNNLSHDKHYVVASTPENIADCMLTADVVIGCVHVPGAATNRLVTKDMIKMMEPGSVIVDVAIDQGGCFETSRPTTHADPVYTEFDVTHYCVANMPGTVPRTASSALSRHIIDYAKLIADHGIDGANRLDSSFSSGINVRGGQIVHPAVKKALNL